jgi:hypothetical protein
MDFFTFKKKIQMNHIVTQSNTLPKNYKQGTWLEQAYIFSNVMYMHILVFKMTKF